MTIVPYLGMPVSHGVVRGMARVVRSLEEANQIQVNNRRHPDFIRLVRLYSIRRALVQLVKFIQFRPGLVTRCLN